MHDAGASHTAGARPRLSGDAFDERRLQVLVGYSASLRWQMVLTATVMGGVAWAGGGPLVWVLTWLLCTLAIRELRAIGLLRLRSDAARPIALRLRAAMLWTLLLGAAYGAAALFMPALDTASAAILTMILMSLSAGAVSTTFTVVKAFVAFAAGISVPTALMWFVTGGWIGVAVGTLVLMFLNVQVKFARQNMQLFEESYAMRLENQALLQQLSQERAQLAQARDMAVQADLSKSRFLASASHDLRQPLQGLLLNTGALSRMPVEGEARTIVTEIGEGIETLRRMLDALLDVSKLDAGAVSPNFQAIPLERLLDGICARFGPAAQAKGLRLSHQVEAGLTVTSDVEMLRRLVGNLVDNAIKFTAAGAITLSARRDTDRVVLTISDTGSGVDQSDRDRVFEDLAQLQNPQRDRAAGHGLGLGIVRRLARLLGIEYMIESQPGTGTSFHLRLPVADLAAPVVSEVVGVHPSLVAKRLLVLDDDADVRASYAHALTSLGCNVACVGTLEEALASVVSREPEVAIVDYRLADGCTGLQAIERLRAARPTLAAVIVSADTSALLRDEAARAGVALLRKPVTDATLVATINDALHEASAGSRESASRSPG
jgi:signal transduction histidine kinase/CheY-like chemotaxis protein